MVYSTVYPGADQRKHQSSASPAFMRGIHRGPGNSPHKWPVTRKMSPFDDVIIVRHMWEGSACFKYLIDYMNKTHILCHFKTTKRLCDLQVGCGWRLNGSSWLSKRTSRTYLEKVLTFLKNPNCTKTLIQYRTITTISLQSPKHCF